MRNRVNNFFKEYEELCKKYNLSLSQENREGIFFLEPYNENNISWVKCAYIKEYKGYIKCVDEEDELKRLTEERDRMKTELEEMIGNENWVLLDDEIFDLMECETVRPATEEEMELRTKIRRTELKMSKYL